MYERGARTECWLHAYVLYKGYPWWFLNWFVEPFHSHTEPCGLSTQDFSPSTLYHWPLSNITEVLFFFLVIILFVYISNDIPGYSSMNLPIPSLLSPLPFVSMRVLLHPFAHSLLTPLAPHYSGHQASLPSHWCQTRPSSATYVSGVLVPSIYTLWFVD